MAGPVEPQRHTLSAADQLPQLGLSAAFVVLVRDDEPVRLQPLSFPSPCSAGVELDSKELDHVVMRG